MPLPEHVKERLPHLRRWANRLAGYYGCHIYLTGSALFGDNAKPRDWDIRIEMPDSDFEVRFGNVQDWVNEGGSGQWTDVRWRWSRQCVKDTKAGWYATGLNIDFQIYPKSHCRRLYAKFPKYRLDKMPKLAKAIREQE